MNTLRIVLKEFRQQIRDWKTDSLMMLFPIVLVAILGAALSGTFSNLQPFSDIHVLYTLEASGPMSSAFGSLSRQLEASGLQFSAAPNKETGISDVQNAAAASYLIVADRRITLYGNARMPVETGIVKSVVTAFLLRYNALAAVAASSPPGNGPAAALQTGAGAAGSNASYVEVRSLDAKRKPSAMDFYSVTMLTLIIMYASVVGMGKTSAERRLGTGNRILCAPVNRAQFLGGKVVGSLLAVLVQMTVVIAFTRYAFGAYWGHDLATVGLLVLAESVMASSIGVGVTYLIRSEAAAAGLLNTIIPVFAFFGGSYVPPDIAGPAIQSIGFFSPITWLNRALFGVIYDHDYSAVAPAVLIAAAVSVIFIGAAALLSRREGSTR